jgi:hypothetical protein
VERAALQRREPLGHQLGAAIDKARLLGAVLPRAPRDVFVIGLVRLPEVRRIRVWNRSLRAHPMKRGARIEAARKRDANFFAGGNALKDRRHPNLRPSSYGFQLPRVAYEYTAGPCLY